MENRRAIHIRNVVAALWVGFGVPTACIWILIEDQHNWLNQHWDLAALVLVTYFAPAVFLAVLEVNRRASKARRTTPYQSEIRSTDRAPRSGCPQDIHSTQNANF